MLSRLGGLLLLSLALAAPAAAQDLVGSVASLQGKVDVVRGGVAQALDIGAAIFTNDEIRTGRPGRVRVVFRDKSVLVISDDSLIAVNEQLVESEGSAFESIYELLQGKVRALVSEYYKDPRARFELRTKTAVSGVKGTEFVVVYDPISNVTEVVGVSGTVAVWSPLDPKGSVVVITEQQITRVGEGQAPSPAESLDEATFEKFLDGSQLPGDGLPESLAEAFPVLSGGEVPLADRAAPVSGVSAQEVGGGVPNTEGFPENSAPTIGDVLQQPVDQVEAAGSVRIGF